MARRPSALQRELRQSRPFHSTGHEAVLALLRTAGLVRRGFARVVEAHGVTGQQYNVLRILRGAGREGLCTLAVAERMIEATPGITRLVDRLERKGWVRRERQASDRREVRCVITPAGLRLLAALDAPVAEADDALVAGLSRAEQRRLVALLERVRSGG